ncbi:hypothetical protein DXN05_03005 [Deminuibacter soli]|uniref:Uncharacterized protein n=1 Tax=Deminuibacter soli TaxID=2291815 RepID=A0A3E1NPX9_9BACT|nr:hypothetical protein DXN05_03005 [Deminuibacter soli]
MPKTILVVCCVLCKVFAQAQTHTDSTSIVVKTLQIRDSAAVAHYPIRLIPANYYTNHLPFFCDKELKLEKAVKFPVKIRLGSVDYVDQLEGKH